MKQYYAYFIYQKGLQGIVDSWKECEKIVSGVKGARFKRFSTYEDAEKWLKRGAPYDVTKPPELEPGLYFDAGTGRGIGLVEVNVTNEKGENQLVRILNPKRVNKFGTYVITQRHATNNYGELMGLKFALRLALREGIKKIFGDSKLVINYWSKGYVKRGVHRRSTYKLVDTVVELRKQFEESGGAVGYISGDHNPADLGFH